MPFNAEKAQDGQQINIKKMATVYKIKIKTVSAFVNYDEKYMKELLEKFLKEYRDKDNKLGFENTEVEVERS